MKQKKIISNKKHNINPNHIDEHALFIIEKLVESGFEAYLVGGSVRDLLQGLTPKDFDIATSAQPHEIKKLFRHCLLIGKRFRLAHVKFGKKFFEVATFRTGDIEDETLIVRDNDWGNPEEDAKRRDFTINGLFYDPKTENVIDYVGGFVDMEKKILRTIGNPAIRFLQDPVRMIRLLKFKARFNFEIEKDSHTNLIKCKKAILNSSQARILEELLRMLESGYCESFFKLLYEYGLLELLLPFLHKEFEKDTDNLIMTYLENADNLVRKNFFKNIDRTILSSCLLFTIFEKRIQKVQIKRKNIHLGIISEIAKDFVKEIFSPFFIMPKRMRAKICGIMTHQYRIVMLQDKKFKIPRDESFPLAMHFCKIRCHIFPTLYKTYTKWNEKIIKIHKKRVEKYNTFAQR